jgi:ribosomal protein L11 methylase PrmA
MLPQLYAFVHEGTRVVTSGIIVEQSERVKGAFLENGYALIDTMTENDWVSFVFKKL